MSNRGFPYFLMGVGVGAVAGLLLAPRSGRETREQLGGWLKRKREETEESLQHLRDKVRDEKDRLATALKAGREAYQPKG